MDYAVRSFDFHSVFHHHFGFTSSVFCILIYSVICVLQSALCKDKGSPLCTSEELSCCIYHDIPHLSAYQSHLGARGGHGTDNLGNHHGPTKGQPGDQAQSKWVDKREILFDKRTRPTPPWPEETPAAAAAGADPMEGGSRGSWACCAHTQIDT